MTVGRDGTVEKVEPGVAEGRLPDQAVLDCVCAALCGASFAPDVHDDLVVIGLARSRPPR
ncbi:MAG: hypothetical protein HY905_14860 [Deltaproteobacteria bacterium]|nr:hypothetical protein [Deltaproteobacteria bacterium]